MTTGPGRRGVAEGRGDGGGGDGGPPAATPPTGGSAAAPSTAGRGPGPRRTARAGEELAAEALRRAGLQILDRNWRSGRQELDIVAREGDVVAFVEVKARRPGPQAPLEAIGRAKQRQLRRAAARWIRAHPGVGREFRFDAVAVEVPRRGPPRVEHVRAAFWPDGG